MRNPVKFGLTRNKIDQIYKRHKERPYIEGEAREEILKNLTDEGWIRIRRYPNAYWSIQFGRMNPRVKKQVNRFAFSARKGINGTKESDPYMDVILVGFYDNYRKRIDIKSLAATQMVMERIKLISIDDWGDE